ncbi:MAG: hypothetical protein M1333_00345 [Patescibacteria group bacterium]|nr:hypothetical protein [Patescibacteria group bacterium]
MSKNRNSSTQKTISTTELQTAEHLVIKHDLWKVLILNLVYLAGLMALYFANQRSHFLETWFAKLMNM